MRLLVCACTLAVVAACGSPPAPADGGQKSLTVVVTPPTAKGNVATAPIDLVEGDGEVLLHVDLAAWRKSVAFPFLRELVVDESYELRQVRSRCGLDVLDALDVVASSHHKRRGDPLTVARFHGPAKPLWGCAEKVLEHHRPGVVEGHRSLEQHRLHFMIVDDLLFYGSRTEVKRALARRRSAVCGEQVLRTAITAEPKNALAIAVDGTPYEVETGVLSISLDGQKLQAKGRVSFRDYDERKRETWAQYFDADVREVMVSIRVLMAMHLGAQHPLLDSLTAKLATEDGTVRGSLTIAFDASMKAMFDRAPDMWNASTLAREAQLDILAMSRGAAAAYERERVSDTGEVLAKAPCKSAVDVPAAVPRGTTHTPSNEKGKDFNTGNRESGWDCLKSAFTRPTGYQFSYRQGGNYKGPARGGPDPGPDGYEISAEGDFDGDGKTSLFTVIGIVDPTTQKLRQVTKIFASDPLE